MKYRGAIAILGGVVLLDQISKAVAGWVGWVSLNPGIAFGWGGQELAVIHGVALLALMTWWWYERNSAQATPLSLVVAGGLANMLDRVRLGGVQDWLPIPWTGLHNNFADYAVVLGFAWWFYTMYQAERFKHHDN